MKKWMALPALLLLHLVAQAQPYLDVAGVRYQASPDAGALRRGQQPNSYHFGAAGMNVPLVLKDSSVLLLNPSAETWQIKSPTLPHLPVHLHGLALPVTFVKPFSPRWSAAFVAVARWHGAHHFGFDDRLQLGGAVLLSRKRSETLTYKFGLYYNREAFGHFVMPLAGIDWRPSPKLRVFGVLPGNAVIEKKASSHFYYGLSFRATTTSFRFRGASNAPHFIRIDDNTLQAFADLYLTKNVVLNAEGGHSFFRRFRLGEKDAANKYFVTDKFSDNLLFRISLLYRVRFDAQP